MSWPACSALLATISVRSPDVPSLGEHEISQLVFLNDMYANNNVASNPTGSSREAKVSTVKGSEPWQTGSSAAYKYYPYGDETAEAKDAPSPLRTAIIPNVNLPKVSLPSTCETRRCCNEVEELTCACDSRSCMNSSTNMARRNFHKEFESP